jgi:hypothetical protein
MFRSTVSTIILESRFPLSRILIDSLALRLLKKVQIQGGARWVARGVLTAYVAAPPERANAVDGPFSAAG